MSTLAKLRGLRVESSTAYTSYINPTDELSYNDLSGQQRKVVELVREDMELYKLTGTTLKHGVIIVGSWGSGKTQVLYVMRKMGLISTILDREEVYGRSIRGKTGSIEEIVEEIVEDIRSLANKIGHPFIALDNLDIPSGNITGRQAFNITWKLIEEATLGKLPYLVVALNEFTYRRFSDEKKASMAKIAQHFNIVKLEWSPEEVERAVKTKLLEKKNIGGKEKLLKEIIEVARTPRSAITLLVKALTMEKSILDLVVSGLRGVFDEYTRVLSQSNYRLSRSKTRKWISIWRSIIGDKEYRELVVELMRREGVEVRKLYSILGGDYKTMHWVLTVPTKYHVIEEHKPLSYRFTTEFLAIAIDYAVGMRDASLEMLRTMAEIYSRAR